MPNVFRCDVMWASEEVIVTFSSKQRELAEAVTTSIQGQSMVAVEEDRYLGTFLVAF